MNVKLFIATPAFEGKTHVPFAISLSETVLLLAKNHIQCEYRIVTSGSLLESERNRLVRSFLESDCTHMLCIDSDLGWPAEAVLGMLSKKEEFVAGVYPNRIGNSFTFRPCVREEDGAIITNPEKQLLKMEYVPAGFMLIKRSVFEKVMSKFPDLNFVPKASQEPPGFVFFLCELFEGEFWGEDYTFCRNVRAAGVDIWVDPMIQFNHDGQIGMLAQVLTNDKAEAKAVEA